MLAGLPLGPFVQSYYIGDECVVRDVSAVSWSDVIAPATTAAAATAGDRQVA